MRVCANSLIFFLLDFILDDILMAYMRCFSVSSWCIYFAFKYILTKEKEKRRKKNGEKQRNSHTKPASFVLVQNEWLKQRTYVLLTI